MRATKISTMIPILVVKKVRYIQFIADLKTGQSLPKLDYPIIKSSLSLH